MILASMSADTAVATALADLADQTMTAAIPADRAVRAAAAQLLQRIWRQWIERNQRRFA